MHLLIVYLRYQREKYLKQLRLLCGEILTIELLMMSLFLSMLSRQIQD